MRNIYVLHTTTPGVMRPMYERTCDLIYRKISARAETMKDKYELTLAEIFSTNPTIASYILRNKRTNNNPYLVPGKKFTNDRSTTRFVELETPAEHIASSLHFDSVANFLWGDVDEFAKYSGETFLYLIKDAMNDADPSDIEIIQKALSFYVPYAKCQVYRDVLSDNNNFSKILEFDYNDDNEGEDFLNAISRLFLNVKDEFHKAYFDFFSDKTTIHLNNYISKFVHDEFVPMLSAYIDNDRSIGKTFLPIIETVTEYLPNYVYDSIPEELITDSDRFQIDANNKLADSTFKYIKSLEIYQKKIEGDHNFKKILNDNWTSDDCIKANKHSQ